MTSLNNAYQEAVDKLALQLVGSSFADLDERPSYGSLKVSIAGKEVTVGYWHFQMIDNQHHIIFKASRRVLLFLHKVYVNGVVVSPVLNARKMTDEEIALHD